MAYIKSKWAGRDEIIGWGCGGEAPQYGTTLVQGYFSNLVIIRLL